MARQESDREDLMAEATALVRRVELAVPGEDAPVVAGVRKTGQLSIYLGSDPVYHYDSRNRLRRAFVDGRLYRTQGSFLAELTRIRTPQETQLRYHALVGPSLDQFLERMKGRLERLHEAFALGTIEILRQVPEENNWVAELSERVAGVLNASEPLAPPIKCKRT